MATQTPPKSGGCSKELVHGGLPLPVLGGGGEGVDRDGACHVRPRFQRHHMGRARGPRLSGHTRIKVSKRQILSKLVKLVTLIEGVKVVTFLAFIKVVELVELIELIEVIKLVSFVNLVHLVNL